MENTLIPQELIDYAKSIPTMQPYVHTEKFKEQFEQMAVHTRKLKPEDLLLDRRPNEPKDVFDYRIENYEPITYGSMNKAFDNLNRILTRVNYRLESGNEKVENYLITNKFMRNTFNMFFSRVYLKRMIEDANGLLLWLPGGKGTTSSSFTVEPYPVLILSFNILDWTDETLTVLSDEANIITDSEGSIKKVGKVYYILTKQDFYKYTEFEDKWVLTHEYKHNIGEIPMIVLGGDLTADGFYESFFSPYLAFGNEAIRQFSDWQALSTTAAHPIREEFYTQCLMKEVDRKKGIIDKEQDDNLTYSRSVQLQPINRSPYGVVQRPIGESNPNGLGEQYLPYDVPSVRFISPPIEFVTQAEKSYQALIEMAEDSLHLNLGDVSLSGKAKEIDLLSHEDMLSKIANQLLANKQLSVKFIVAYMDNKQFENVVVKLIKPSSFRVRTENELTKELTDLKGGNAPSMLVSAVARELAALRFSGDEINQKIFEVIATYDPLFTYSVAEKQSMVLAGIVDKNDTIKSAFIYSLLLSISKSKGEAEFLNKTSEEVYKLFLEAIKPYLSSEIELVNNDGIPE